MKVPIFKTIAEEAKFWDTHDSEDFPGYWQPAPEIKFSKNLKSIYTGSLIMRIDSQTRNAVAMVAKVKGLKTSTAARMLLRERLVQLKALQDA